jgi:glycine betaine/choline ABC-type transport system substrate-binding protein
LLLLLVALTASCVRSPAPPSLAVGATADAGSLVLANVYAGALRGSGVPAHVETTTNPFARLDSGAVDVMAALTGELLQRLVPGADVRSDKQVYRAMVGALPEGIAAGDYATAAEDKPALLVTEATAEKWGGTDLGVLPGHCDKVLAGAVRGTSSPARVGRCRLVTAGEFADASALLAALRSGEVTAAWTTTATPGTPADLVMLVDRDPALVRAENVVPLYRRNGLAERQVLALNEVAGVLDTAALVEMRGAVADGGDPQAIADGWLAENPLGR